MLGEGPVDEVIKKGLESGLHATKKVLALGEGVCYTVRTFFIRGGSSIG